MCSRTVPVISPSGKCPGGRPHQCVRGCEARCIERRSAYLPSPPRAAQGSTIHVVHAVDCHESRLGDGACHAPGAGRHVVGRHGRRSVSVSGKPGDHGGGHGTPLAVYTTRDGLTAQQVFRLFEDSRGNIWISVIHPSANGLGRWDPRTGNDSRPDARQRASRVPRRPPAFVRGRAVWHTVVWLQQWPRALRARHVHLFHAERGIAARRDYGHPR